MMDDFAIFICTYGRPNNQLTLNMLRNSGYIGRIYLVLDDTDATIQQYIDNYGTNSIIIFDKNYYINSVETISNNPKCACIIYAKNAVEDIAKQMKLKSFVIADDDVFSLRLRYVDSNALRSKRIICNMSDVIEEINNFLLDTNLCAVSPLYTTFFMDGVKSFESDRIESARYMYIFVFRNSVYDVKWISDYAEDNITSFEQNKIGNCMLGIPFVQHDSTPPKKRIEGGMSETYASNTFLLCMRGCTIEPAYMSAQWYKTKFVPKIQRKNSLPKIISGRYKK